MCWVALILVASAALLAPTVAEAQTCPPVDRVGVAYLQPTDPSAPDRCVTLGEVLGVALPIQFQNGQALAAGALVTGQARGSDLQPMQSALGAGGAVGGPAQGAAGAAAPGVSSSLQPGQVPGQPLGIPGLLGGLQPGVVPATLSAGQPVLRALTFDRALAQAYVPVPDAPNRAAFTRDIPPNAPVMADPRTVSMVLHTHGPFSWTDDRVMTSSPEVIFTALPATAYGPQPPPPPCRAGLVYTGTGNARAGDIAPGPTLAPPLSSSQVTGEQLSDVDIGACGRVTYTINPQP